MDRSWKKVSLAGVVLGTLLALIGWAGHSMMLSSSAPASGSASYDNEKILIHGLKDQEFEVTLGDLKKLPTVTKHAEATQSNGTKIKVDATGPLLDTFLQQYGKSQKDFSRIRLTAKDNYSVAVPPDVLKSRQIILSYANDGKPLKDEWQPLRIIIPGERSMYWVNDMVRIDFETGAASEPAKKVVFIETAAKNLPQEDYQYFESVDKAIKTKDLIAKYGDLDDQTVANAYL
ncbi:MAG TPA: molybdopterin-dependent oxidoreductase, partial [Desulfosporosinus sp.]|nr:molybdopterin-dependent oxidoreductase [Desulfosporosinus sp.]